MDKIFNIFPQSGEIPEFSIASYNIQRQDEEGELIFIFEKILFYQPDILALQGVTKFNCEVIFRILKKQGYQGTRFDHSGLPRQEFEIIFSKITVKHKGYCPFVRTNQNKGLVKYLVVAGERTQKPFEVCVYSSCFEPGAEGNVIRKTQILEMAAERVKDNLEIVIFAGDTSIPSWQEAAIRCPEGWKDAWREKGNSSNEKTSLHDRTDQIWYYGNVEPVEFSTIRIDPSIDIRAGVFAKFRKT